MFITEITVRFNECDALGHVNNTNYFIYFEQARTEIFRIFNPELSIHSWNLIVASTACDFLREITYAQTIRVYTWISRIGRSSFDVEHAIQDEKQNWVARGRATMIRYDFTERRSIPLSGEICALLRQHEKGPAGVPEMRK